MESKTMIPGLHHQLAANAQTAAAKRLIADDPASAPFIAYSAHEDTVELARDMVALGLHIEENETAVLRIQELLDSLAASTHKSRHRSLTITWLEAAQDRLRRELGDPAPPAAMPGQADL
jgi:thiamine monophosphate synthase